MKTASLVLAVWWLLCAILAMVRKDNMWVGVFSVQTSVWLAAWYVMIHTDKKEVEK